MKVGEKEYSSIWLEHTPGPVVKVIDQERLPFFFEIKELRTVEDIYRSIKTLTVRGAPVIGVAGAYGLYISAYTNIQKTNFTEIIKKDAEYLISCRPTAINLAWAVRRVQKTIEQAASPQDAVIAAGDEAEKIRTSEIENCRQIGIHGFSLIEEISSRKNGAPVNILTHCNAGWLATVDYGTVLAPVYLAYRKNIPVHVWVDETRPRNQGARLTAWELENEGVPCSLVTDNAGGHLMQHGMVDIVIAGSDRCTRRGDVANKIGTYLKALAAFHNGIPFYSALPSSTIDFSISDGVREIPVEEREEKEVKEVEGFLDGKIISVRICPDDVKAVNFGFDITPAHLVTGLITERGICSATEEGIKNMFSDKFNA